MVQRSSLLKRPRDELFDRRRDFAQELVERFVVGHEREARAPWSEMEASLRFEATEPKSAMRRSPRRAR